MTDAASELLAPRTLRYGRSRGRKLSSQPRSGVLKRWEIVVRSSEVKFIAWEEEEEGGGPNLIATTSFSGVSVLAKKIIKISGEEKNDESRRDLLKSAKIIYWQPRHVFH